MCSYAGVYVLQLLYELVQLLYNAGLACKHSLRSSLHPRGGAPSAPPRAKLFMSYQVGLSS